MTRLTQMIIQEDPNVYASSYGPVEGKFGLYVGTVDYSPSGCERPRTLLTSKPIYETAEAAQIVAAAILAEAAAPQGRQEPA